MKEVKYYTDVNVPIYIEPKVTESIPMELTQHLCALAFQRASELDKIGIKTSNRQVFKVKTSTYGDMGTKCNIVMKQVDPDYESEHKKIVLGSFNFEGNLILNEYYNPNVKGKTGDNHYISLEFSEQQ